MPPAFAGLTVVSNQFQDPLPKPVSRARARLRDVACYVSTAVVLAAADNHRCSSNNPHSVLKALMGSIEAARRAGMLPARSAQKASTAIATVITRGSYPFTP